MMKIVGTLINQDLKPITNTLICIKTDSLCVATGGTNRFGNDLIILKRWFWNRNNNFKIRTIKICI